MCALRTDVSVVYSGNMMFVLLTCMLTDSCWGMSSTVEVVTGISLTVHSVIILFTDVRTSFI